FSSRRRHTRFSRDWSSDVCSSDLRDNLHTLFLCLSEKGSIFCPFFIRCYLCVVKREVSLFPSIPPIVHHTLEHLNVLLRHPFIGFTLIPQHPSNPISYYRMNHCIKYSCRALIWLLYILFPFLYR